PGRSTRTMSSLPSFVRQCSRLRSSESSRSRLLRSRLTAAGTVSAADVSVPGRGEYGKTCTREMPASATTSSVRSQARSSEARKPVAGFAVAIAPEVDAGQHHLAVALVDTPPHLAQDGGGASAPRRPPDERDHAERAREAAAVLHLHEGANAVELGIRLDAADRPDVAGDRAGRVLAAAGHDGDVLR